MTPPLPTRTELWTLLGEADVAPQPVRVVRGGTERVGAVSVRHLVFTAAHASIPALLLLPPQGRTRGGLVLLCHAHGHNFALGKTECLAGRPAMQSPPLALALAEAGHAVLCPDMPGFGERQHEGSESALSKALHWQGGTLFGQMLRELCLILDSLAAVPEAPSGPRGVVGFSMGAFLSFWLAALRPDVAACAHLCGFASMAPLVASGAHDLHAPYLTVPGLLRRCDFGDVAALIAPRPQLVASGLADPLTPPHALLPALERLARAYAGLDTLTILTDAHAAHVETPQIRRAVLTFFDVHL